MPEAHEVAQSLRFAPALIEMATRIIRNISGGSGHPPNGLHYRIEGDAKAHKLFSDIGGEHVRDIYTQKCRVGSHGPRIGP